MEKKKRILVVEDEPGSALAIARILRPMYDVVLARDGREGLECALALPGPDLILSDVHMPGFSGLEMVNRIRDTERGRKIPVIFLTAMGSAQNIVDGYRAGAKYYMGKPIDVDELLDTIEAALKFTE